jgi:hypothetical protein
MTFDEVDEQLTLPRYNALQRFWMKHPPTQILLAGYVGYKGTGASAPAAGGTTEDLADLDEESASALFSIFGAPVKPQQG